jgi:hypothetical protein
LKRLLKTSDRPRENFKKLKVLFEMNFEVDNITGLASEDIIKFKEWIGKNFPLWNETVLQHFLYEHNLCQDEDNKKYLLEIKMREILTDDVLDDKLNDHLTDKELEVKEKQNSKK